MKSHFLARVAVVLFAATGFYAQAEGGVPAFSITAPNGKTNVLIGSLHIPHERLRQPAPAVFDGATRFVVEGVTAMNRDLEWRNKVPILKQEQIDLFLRLSSGRASWARRLTDEQLERFRASVACHTGQLPKYADLLLVRDSPMAASVLAFLPCAPAGLLSRDELLAREALARKIPVVGLESEADMGPRRRSIPDRMYADMIQNMARQDVTAELAHAVNAFNTGNFEEILAISLGALTDPADVELYYRVMVRERNEAWVPALRLYLDEGNAVVLVGAAHLPGAHGLVSLLSQAGYTVKPILLPAIVMTMR